MRQAAVAVGTAGEYVHLCNTALAKQRLLLRWRNVFTQQHTTGLRQFHSAVVQPLCVASTTQRFQVIVCACNC
jgi:hypothetical protein